MGDGSIIPSYSLGMNILLVDDDEKSLMYLSSMLEQFSYKVTRTKLVTSALSMIEEQKDRFKLVMANVNMPDMDSLQFLHSLLEKDIPVILVSQKRSVSAAEKAIAKGASFYLSEPVFPDDLKYIWQHAYRNKGNRINRKEKPENQEIKVVVNNEEKKSQRELDNNMNKKTSIGQSIKRKNEEKEEQNGKEKRKKITDDEQVNKNWIFEEKKKNGKSKKPRVVWTPQLHLKFTAAISELGDKKARPKPILEIMNVPNLTARQVASHLQKYRCQVQRICENGNTNLPPVSKSSNFYGRTKILKNTTASSSSHNYGKLIGIVKASSNNCTSVVTNWKRQEMDCIALIKSLDDGNKKVEVSNHKDHVKKNDIETSNNINSVSQNIVNNDDCFNEWMKEVLNLDMDEIPNLDEIVMKTDPHEDILNVLSEERMVDEPNPSHVDGYLNWLAQTLLGEE